MIEPASGAFFPDPRKVGLRGDVAVVVWVSLLPLMLLVVSLLGAFVEDNRGSWIGDVLLWWNLIGIFGAMVFVPLVAVSLVGAGTLFWRIRLGRWLVTLSSSVVLLLAALLVYGGIAEFVDPSELRDPNSWAGPLELPGTALYVAPYVMMVAANVYVLVRLWRRN